MSNIVFDHPSEEEFYKLIGLKKRDLYYFGNPDKKNEMRWNQIARNIVRKLLALKEEGVEMCLQTAFDTLIYRHQRYRASDRYLEHKPWMHAICSGCSLLLYSIERRRSPLEEKARNLTQNLSDFLALVVGKVETVDAEYKAAKARAERAR